MLQHFFLLTFSPLWKTFHTSKIRMSAILFLLPSIWSPSLQSVFHWDPVSYLLCFCVAAISRKPGLTGQGRQLASEKRQQNYSDSGIISDALSPFFLTSVNWSLLQKKMCFLEPIDRMFRELVCLAPEFLNAAPKVMPPVYFHGKYNRYEEHNNNIW